MGDEHEAAIQGEIDLLFEQEDRYHEMEKSLGRAKGRERKALEADMLELDRVCKELKSGMSNQARRLYAEQAGARMNPRDAAVEFLHVDPDAHVVGELEDLEGDGIDNLAKLLEQESFDEDDPMLLAAMARCAVEDMNRNKVEEVQTEVERRREERAERARAEREALELVKELQAEQELIDKMREKERKIAQESKKQRAKREAAEAEAAAAAAAIEKQRQEEELEKQKLEALMDPDRDPSQPLPFDKAEVASLSRKERQKMYIEHQLWAIHAYEDQISKLEADHLERKRQAEDAEKEAHEAERMAAKMHEDAKAKIKLCEADKISKTKEYKVVEAKRDDTVRRCDARLAKCETDKVTMARQLELRTEERVLADHRYQDYRQQVASAKEHSTAMIKQDQVKEDKERLARLGKVDRYTKEVLAAHKLEKEYKVIYEQANQYSTRKKEYKDNYQNQKDEVARLRALRDEAVASEQNLNEERRQALVDKMNQAYNDLTAARGAEADAKQRLDSTIEDADNAIQEVKQVKKEAAHEFEVADASRLKAVQVEGQCIVAEAKVKRMYRKAHVKKQENAKCARQARDMQSDLVKKRRDLDKLIAAFEKITKKKYERPISEAEIKAQKSMPKVGEPQQGMSHTMKAFLEAKDEPPDPLELLYETDPAYSYDGRLGVKSPPQAWEQNLEYMAAQNRARLEAEAKELEAQEAQRKDEEKDEQKRLAEEERERVKEAVYKKRMMDEQKRLSRIRAQQQLRLREREADQKAAEEAKQEEAQRKLQKKRAAAQAIADEKLRRRGLQPGAQKKGKVKPWVGSRIAKSLAQTQPLVGSCEEEQERATTAARSHRQSLDHWWPDGPGDALGARARVSHNLGMTRMLRKQAAVHSSLSMMLDKDSGESLTRHLGGSRPHTTMGGVQEPMPGGANGTFGAPPVWRPRILTPLGSSPDARSSVHTPATRLRWQ